jgi:putative ABC transport system substrate-binding protein
MRRRDFITLFGGAAAWPLVARAEPAGPMRRIGILVPLDPDDPRTQANVSLFLQALTEKGWTVGRNIQVDTRLTTDNSAEILKHASDLVALGPDVILAHGAPAVRALLLATRSIPIVFPIIADPVAAGVVDSLARPGGNATGFMTAEYGTAGKWLELLKEIAPRTTRAAVFRDPAVITGASQFAAIQAVSFYVRVEIIPINVGQASEIERDIVAFARSPNGGLLIPQGGGPRHHR